MKDTAVFAGDEKYFENVIGEFSDDERYSRTG
jgi:hypothetical protein